VRHAQLELVTERAGARGRRRPRAGALRRPRRRPARWWPAPRHRPWCGRLPGITGMTVTSRSASLSRPPRCARPRSTE